MARVQRLPRRQARRPALRRGRAGDGAGRAAVDAGLTKRRPVRVAGWARAGSAVAPRVQRLPVGAALERHRLTRADLRRPKTAGAAVGAGHRVAAPPAAAAPSGSAPASLRKRKATRRWPMRPPRRRRRL
ncbi:MAG: hypothetical protein MZW92_70110 [Comamonadaceae bacterium]|nr:hypothetical protein [Comamonadaceae bacterium]